MEKHLLKKKPAALNSESTKSLNDIANEGPSEQVILNILNYSKALSVSKSKLLKHIETVLN